MPSKTLGTGNRAERAVENKMPSKTLGTGNRKGAIQRPNTSNTSPAAMKLQQRRARALELRLLGRTFRAIARDLKCSPQTALNYVIQGLRDAVPKETQEQVLGLELRRFDALLEKYYPLALKGDQSAAELCLKISHQRSRLCGLYDQPPLLALKAERPNIKVSFVSGCWQEREDGSAYWQDAETPDRPKTIEHLPPIAG